MNKLLKSKKFFVAIICIIVILMIAIIGFLLKSSNENITGNVALGIYDSAIKTADVLNTVSGNAIYDTYLGFSNPESRFAINIRNITFENDSDIAYVTFTVKDYIIYEKGYVSLDGQDWAEFTLNPVGELKDGWIKYGATATIAMNKNALRLSDARTETSENYAIVYTCSIVNKSWDCHNGWQIVDFRAQFKKKPTAIINNTNTTNNGSGTTGGSTGGAGTNTTGNATQNTTNTTAPSNTTSNTTISSDVLAYCKQVCDHIIYPNQSYVRGYQIGNILPGDTICIPAGTRRELSLLNTRGSPSNPITITNCGGQAIIDASLDTGHGILLQNVSYFRLTGTGDSNFKYGIKVINADSSGIAATSLSTDMEIDHLEIANVGFAGLLLKTDPGCSMTAAREYFVQYNTLAHDNYIHDVAGEGIYLGSSFYLGGHVHRCNNVSISIAPGDVTNIGIPTSPNYDAFVMGPGWSCQQVGSGSGTIANNTLVTFKVPGSSKEYQGAYKGGPVSMTGSSMLCNNASLLILPHEIKGVRVYNNIIRNSGWDCLQVGSSTSDVEIYNNSLIGCGLEGVYGQTIAMQINPGTTGKIYNNYIEGGAHGIQLQGAGDNIIFNNIIVDSEGDGIITTGSADAIRPGKGYHIENNLILNPIRYGVYIITSATTGTTIRNNIVIGGQQTVRAGSTTIANSIISNNLNNSNISFYKFVNPAAKNYHYSSDSPMVNAGTPTSDWFVTKDLDSVSRPQGVAYDVGPYEYVAAAIVDQDSDGYAADDCDNSNPAINPGAVEICGNGIDENCDLADAVCPIVAIDSDSDGVNSTADCNDSNAAVWVLRTGYPDFDYDSYTLASQQICSGNSLPSGYRNTTAGTDCADNNANINPSKIEICGNNIDENCNGSDLACPAPSSNGDLCDTSVTVSACFSHFGRLQTLVDGNYSTYDDSWNGCASSPEWWQFTFQNAKTINKISFLEKNFVDGWIASSPLYYVEYLDSNNQWRQAANIKRSPTNVAGSYVGVSWNNVSFDNITTTSFRLMLYSGGSSTFTGLGEVECFAEATTPLPTCSDGIKNGAETDVDCGGTCAACTIDSDSDGFNSANDCNDNNAAVWILRTGYSDSDNDGYTIGTLQQICSGNSLPAGYKPTSLGTDCADGDANVNPGKTEVCGNGLDDDCSAGDAVCAAPASCSDGIKNNDEIGVDCDGSCPACIIGGGNLSVKFSSGNILGHWVYLPANYNPSRATPYPVVYMLRGSGEDGLGNNQSSMDKLKVNGMLKLISSNSWPPNKAKLTRQEQVEISDMIVIVPQDWSAGTFSYSRLDTLMVHISQTYNIDENRVYGTGLSAGGIGLGTYLVQYAGSSRFAAMVPISPNLNNAQPYACINRDVRIWVFHGANDTNGPTSPYNGPNYKAVAQNCNPLPIVKSTIYPGCGHS
ncbi:MAG TPA: MopE-related protein, partial [Alphaproteobacteria bacterium]|nr:MopE-related protein [Alphaproteobacteria bacterium]